MGMEDTYTGQVPAALPVTSRLRACPYCGRPRLESVGLGYVYPCEGCGYQGQAPRFPPNRVIREGEPTCRTCGSGRSTHDDGTRDHAYVGPLPYRPDWMELFLGAVVLLVVLLVIGVFASTYSSGGFSAWP